MELRKYSPFLPSFVLTATALALNVTMLFGGADWAIIAAITAFSALAALVLPVLRSGGGPRLSSSVRSVRRSDFQITLFEVMVFTSCVSIFFAARRLIPPDRNGDDAVFMIEQFLLFLVIFVGAGVALVWEHQRRLRRASAVPPIKLDPADDKETIDDIVSAVDACPICSAPVTKRGECIGTSSSTLETSPGNIRRITCRRCGASLQGIDFYGGSPTVESAGSSGQRAIRWEALIARKHPPDEVSMVVEQRDQ